MLVSLLRASQEPRLGDLIVNWATHNVDLLSVQRIRNLLQTYPSDFHEVLTSRLAWFAEIALAEGADPRWRPLMKPAQDRDASSSPAPSAIAIEMRTLLEQHRNVLGQLQAASWSAHERVHDWVTFGGEVVRRMALLVHPDTRLPAMEGT
jgi:hypothetical protein